MAILENLPPTLAEALSNPPKPGNRNVWIFTVAKRSRHVATPKKLKTFLQAVSSHWNDRDFSPEIDRAISRAFSTQKPEPPNNTACSISNSPSAATPPWPAFSPAAWERRIADFLNPCRSLLFDATPLSTVTSEEVIDALYKPKALLCMAIDTRSAFTQRREAWRGKEPGLQFIVPNPMTAKTGVTQSGDKSPRSLNNAAKTRTYQVVEFDRGTISEQAAILTSLDTCDTPLVLVVHSGGKSLHGWFDLRDLPHYAQLRFFRHAVHLGADASLWDLSKLVRMPGGRRDNGEPQNIHYFAPRS